MAALPYMQLYVADYLADTAHLSTVEHGAYLLLIFNYWQRGESFRAKDEQTLNRRLTSVARLSADEWENVKGTLEEFFTVSDTEWRHERIERDLEAVSAKASKASSAGKASGARRKAAKTEVSDRSTNDEQSFNERSTNVEQALNHTDTDTDTDKEGKPSADASPPADLPEKVEQKDEKQAKPSIQFKTFIAACKAVGEKPIPEEDPIFDWAVKAGIPDNFLRIAWVEFRNRYSDSSKRYKDWRKVFRNAIKDNWYKLWYMAEDGSIVLSSQGRLIEKTHAEALSK